MATPAAINAASAALAPSNPAAQLGQGLWRLFTSVDFAVAKRVPTQGIVWGAFASLIAGITITFYPPRRRIWARRAPDGTLGLVVRADRYVDVEPEFGALLDDLVAVRPPA